MKITIPQRICDVFLLISIISGLIALNFEIYAMIVGSLDVNILVDVLNGFIRCGSFAALILGGYQYYHSNRISGIKTALLMQSVLISVDLLNTLLSLITKTTFFSYLRHPLVFAFNVLYLIITILFFFTLQTQRVCQTKIYVIQMIVVVIIFGLIALYTDKQNMWAYGATLIAYLGTLSFWLEMLLLKLHPNPEYEKNKHVTDYHYFKAEE